MTDLLVPSRARPAFDRSRLGDSARDGAGEAYEPATVLSGSVAESLAVVVAPRTGRFQPVSGVEEVEPGQLLGHVTGGRGRTDEVRSPVRALVRRLLARPGQLVGAGQGLAWLQPIESTPA